MSTEDNQEELAKNIDHHVFSDDSARNVASPDDELPPELKSIEAELALLAPRSDRLDRDRLIFLAGRASGLALAHATPSTSLGRWCWPAATASITAVAAALLVTLLVHTGSSGDRQSAKNSPHPANDKSVAEDTPPKVRPVDEELPQPAPSSDEPADRAVHGSSLLALLGLGWMPGPESPSVTFGPPDRPYVDRMLAQGLDFSAQASAVKKRDGPRAAVDVSYRQLLEQLRREASSDRARPEFRDGIL